MTAHDDRLLPSILLRGMDEGMKLRDSLQEAEAEERRLRSGLAVVVARVEVLQARYEANRAFTLDVWETTKAQMGQPHDHDEADPAASPTTPAATEETLE